MGCEQQGVLLDCGLSAKAVVARLAGLGVDPEQIRAIVLTHEHSDHVTGARVTSQRLGVPVYMTTGCRGQMADADQIEDLRIVRADVPIRIGPLLIEPFRVPHDTVDPVGFVVGNGVNRLGLVTDLGSVRRDVISRLRACVALILEFNHEPSKVAESPYPDSVKERVLGSYGHLSNAQASALLSSLQGGPLRSVVLAHLSERNNSPELALSAARRAIATWAHPPRLHLASQDSPTAMLTIAGGRM